RKQHRGGVIARADEADGQLLASWSVRPLRSPGRDGRDADADQAANRPGQAIGVRRRVLEQDADRLQRAGGQVGVDRAGVVHRERAGYERRDLEILAREQVQEALQVTALGPADIAGRVVDALELVPVVIPARSVGPGEPDVELLVVVG